MSPSERDSLAAEVEACDREAEVGRQNRDHHQVLSQLERGLHLRRKLYHEGSQEVSAACRRLCEACNFAATVLLQQDDLKGAHELLKRAEQVSDRSDLDRAITWNNMACYYRRTNKLRSAVTFLERALAIEEHTGNADAAQTHLNLCATLSQLGRHGEALQHAQSALIRIYEILAPQLFNGELTLEDISDDSREQFTVLCIAYHNLAVEQEHLKKIESACCAYAEGYRWAGKFLGQSHQLVAILKHSAESVKAKLPASSAAVTRASELMDGWPQAAARSVPQAERSQQLEGLLTPRHAGGNGGIPDDLPSKQSAGRGSEEYSARFSSQEGSYSDEGSRNSGI